MISKYPKRMPQNTRNKQKSVLFVEQSGKGELAGCLREVFTRLESITSFGIKVVEKRELGLL